MESDSGIKGEVKPVYREKVQVVTQKPVDFGQQAKIVHLSADLKGFGRHGELQEAAKAI